MPEQNHAFTKLARSLVVVCLIEPSALAANPDVLLYSTLKNPPAWTHNIPTPDSQCFYFVGSNADGKSLTDGRRLAVEDAASQIVDFLGVKVSTRLISKKADVSNELVDDLRRYGTANIQGTLLREIYHEEWRPYGTRKSQFKVWVLVAYPRSEIERERDRQKALSETYKKEVSGIVSEIVMAARESGLGSLHAGGFKDVTTDRRYSFSRVLENDVQTGLISARISDAGAKSQGYVTGEYKQQGGIVDINVRLVDILQNTSVFALTVSIPMESLQAEWLTLEIPAQESFFAFLDKPKEIRLAQTGALEIISRPSEAQIFVEGENKGKTNLTLHEVPAGTVAVTLVLDDYESFSEVVQIKSGETAHVEAVLKRKVGGLSVESVPSDSNVYLNSKYAGKTPLRLENFPTGPCSLVLKKQNYKEYTQEVTVEFKRIPTITAHLIEEDGSLFVITDVPGATVFLDDQKIGTTRSDTGFKKDSIPAGRHSLRVEKAGFAFENEEITIHAFKVTSKAFNLRPVETGRLEIISNDVGALVEIKGQDRSGQIPDSGKLDIDDLIAKRYSVSISKAGYVTEDIKVTVTAGQTKTIRVALESTEYRQEIQQRYEGAVRSLVLPGWGQYANGDKTKGYTLGALWLTGGLIVWGFEADANSNRNAASSLASTKGQEIDLSAAAPAALQKAKSDDQGAIITAVFMGLVWAYAVGDAFVVQNRSDQSASGWYLTPDIQQARLDTGYRWKF